MTMKRDKSLPRLPTPNTLEETFCRNKVRASKNSFKNRNKAVDDKQLTRSESSLQRCFPEKSVSFSPVPSFQSSMSNLNIKPRPLPIPCQTTTTTRPVVTKTTTQKNCNKLSLGQFVENWKSQSPWTKLVAICNIILLCLSTAAVILPEWTQYESSRIKAKGGLFAIYFRTNYTTHPNDYFFSTYNEFDSIWIPFAVTSEWMWIGRFLAILGIALLALSFALLILHSSNNFMGKDAPEKWVNREWIVLMAFFFGSFVLIISIVFWHGKSCQVCTWLQMVGLASAKNSQFNKTIYQDFVDENTKRNSAPPNQVAEETVYIGHGDVESNDQETKNLGLNKFYYESTLAEYEKEAKKDRMHHAIHGTIKEEEELKKMWEKNFSNRDDFHINITCNTGISAWLLALCFMINTFVIVFLLATTKGSFFEAVSYIDIVENDGYYYECEEPFR